jgi:hypothetical protein
MQRAVCLLCGSLFAASLVGSVGCGPDPDLSESATFPSSPLMTMPTKSAKLSVAVRTAPDQPPSRGVLAVEYNVNDEGGNPMNGLTFDVVPWMPEMGHGASTTPTVSNAGPGRYVISNVEFFMPGQWVLRTTITGAAEDSITPSFEIQ